MPSDDVGPGPDARVDRGHRLQCSRRGNKAGCGCSFSVVWADTLRGCSVSASLVSALMEGWLEPAVAPPLRQIWRTACQTHGVHFSEQTGYRWFKRFTLMQSPVRALLCEKGGPAPAPPDPNLSTGRDEAQALRGREGERQSLRQTWEHMKAACVEGWGRVLAELQVQFQLNLARGMPDS